MSVEVTLNVKELDRIIAQLPDAVERVVDQQAHAVYATARHDAPRKTGRLQDDSDVEPGEDRFTRYVHFKAPYAAYVELGTRFFAGRFFLTRTLERRRNAFADAFQGLAGLVKE